MELVTFFTKKFAVFKSSIKSGYVIWDTFCNFAYFNSYLQKETFAQPRPERIFLL